MDVRLASALDTQLRDWRSALAGGAERVGWKLGMGDRERMGGGPVIGHLTSATRLPAGATYRASGSAVLHADAEVALELGHDVGPGADVATAAAAIARFGAALELVDLTQLEGEPDRVVETNVFHLGVAFGPLERSALTAPAKGRLIVNGEVRAEDSARADYAELVHVVAALLAAMGEQLRAGDRLITGSVVQVPVRVGDDVVADLGELGRVQLSVRSGAGGGR